MNGRWQIKDQHSKKKQDSKKKQNKINIANKHKSTNTFDISKLYLVSSPHRSRLILSFNYMHLKRNRGYINNIFYDQLAPQNRYAVNKLLFKLWDKYQPKRIDTNCGYRQRPGFHCKLIFDEPHFLTILHSVKDNEMISEYIQHFKIHQQNYIEKHEITDFQYFQHDLNIYRNIFQINNENWHPNMNLVNAKKVLSTEKVCQHVLFDMKDMETVLYMEYDTKENYNDFKMVSYKAKINHMIDNMLKVVKYLINRTTNKKHLYPEIPHSVCSWFKFNFRSYQKQQTIESTDETKESEINNSMVIRVEIYVSMVNYLYFVFIYKQQWLKNEGNKIAFDKWFHLYCDYIQTNNELNPSKYSKYQLNSFGCKQKHPDLIVSQSPLN
eukprot:522386_1